MSGPLKGGRNTVIRPGAWLIIHPGTEAQAGSPALSVPQRTEGKMLGPLASKATSGYPQSTHSETKPSSAGTRKSQQLPAVSSQASSLSWSAPSVKWGQCQPSAKAPVR